MNDLTSSIVVSSQTTWNCFLNNGKFVDRVNITWGHTPWDASWACNEWRSECANNGGCRASGDATFGSCNIPKDRIDGCSTPLPDPIFTEVFRNACNNHDSCYHAPWGAIGGDGFKACNDNFWKDMGAACDKLARLGGIEHLSCLVVRSTWADTMNFYPARGSYEEAFRNNQNWVRGRCVQ